MPPWTAWAGGIAPGVVALLAVIVLARDGAATPWDVVAAERSASSRSAVATRLALALGWLGLVPVVAVWAGSAAVVLGRIAGTRWRVVVLIVAVLAADVVVVAAVKRLVDRPRPPRVGWLVAVSTPSFPSGHVTATAAAVGVLVLTVLAGGGSRRVRTVAVLGGAAIVVLMGWSRVYLGVHYLTDVLAGTALGVWLAVSVVWSYAVLVQRSTRRRRRRERGDDTEAEEAVVDRTGTQQHPEARPPVRRRVLAAVSLAALLVLVVQLVVIVLRDPLLLVGGVVGLVLAVAGAWWLVTERGLRRWLGIGGIALGAGALVGAVLAAGTDRPSDLVDHRFLVVALVFLLAVGTARMALAPDLHDLDRRRAGRVRPRHPVLICNLRSGGGKVERFGLIPLAEDLGAEVVVLEPGADLEQLARDAVARGADCLAMAGGDGSQALVASIAVEHDIPFVCVSAGTRNHFALDLGLDRDDPRTGLVALRDGVERRVDYATVGDRLFVNNVSLGVYATVVQEESYREAKAHTAAERLPELLGRQAEPFDLQFTAPDGREVDGAFLVLVSNNPYVLGPSLDVSQRRSLETGRLGVFAVTATTGLAAGRLVARASLGRGARDPDLHEFETTSFEVRSRSGHALAGIDGESLDLPTPLRFAIHPRGLRLLVPEASWVVAERREARAVSPGALAALALGRYPWRGRQSGVAGP